MKKEGGRIESWQQAQENEFGQTVGTLEANAFEPTQDTVLHGNTVCLLPFSTHAHNQAVLEQLWDCIRSEPNGKCWTYLPYSAIASLDQLTGMVQRSFDFQHSLHFFIQVEGAVVGWIGLLNIRPAHGVVEIGNVYFSHQLKQSAAATETIYLLLNACFSRGSRRIEWKCDDLNKLSKRAALRFGFSYDGLFRKHLIVKGRNRNTAWFSMLDDEWLELEKAYAAWLSLENFDPAGLQKRRLQDFIQLCRQE